MVLGWMESKVSVYIARCKDAKWLCEWGYREDWRRIWARWAKVGEECTRQFQDCSRATRVRGKMEGKVNVKAITGKEKNSPIYLPTPTTES